MTNYPFAHPDIRHILENKKPVPWDNMPLCRQNAINAEPPNPFPNSVKVYEKFIDSEAGPKSLRLVVFEPKNAPADNTKSPRPCVLYAHAGGLANRRADTDMAMLCTWANKGIVTISVDYRLAPENKYPSQFDDYRSAYKWLTLDNGAQTVHACPKNIIVGGASAGALLVTSLVMNLVHPPKSLKELGPISLEGAPLPKLVILESPMLAFEKSLVSPNHKFGSYHTVNMDDVNIIREHLLNGVPKGRGVTDSKLIGKRDLSVKDEDLPIDLVPILRDIKDFGDLPPHYISLHELDGLRQGGTIFADKLLEAGTPLEYHIWKGTCHTHYLYGHDTSIAKRLYDELAFQICSHSV